MVLQENGINVWEQGFAVINALIFGKVFLIAQDLKLDRAQARRLSPASIPPATTAPLYTAVGGDESDEFKRQNALIASAWRYAYAGDIPMPGRNHLTVVEELANPQSALFNAAMGMMRR